MTVFAFLEHKKKRSRWVSSTLRRSSTQIRTETLWSNKCSIQMQNTGRDGMEMLHCVLLNGLLGLSPCLYLVLLCSLVSSNSWYSIEWNGLNCIESDQDSNGFNWKPIVCCICFNKENIRDFLKEISLVKSIIVSLLCSGWSGWQHQCWIIEWSGRHQQCGINE